MASLDDELAAVRAGIAAATAAADADAVSANELRTALASVVRAASERAKTLKAGLAARLTQMTDVCAQSRTIGSIGCGDSAARVGELERAAGVLSRA